MMLISADFKLLTRPLVLLSITSVMLTSCLKGKQTKNEVTRIDVATGDCFGPCQLTAISTDSLLNLHYFKGELLPGKPRKVLKSYFSGRFTKQLWDDLNIKLERINFKKLDTSYEESVDDQSLEMVIFIISKKPYQGTIS